MIHNNKVYANADEKFVKGTIIHIGTDGMLYKDENFTVKVKYSDILDLFLNGVIIKMNPNMPDYAVATNVEPNMGRLYYWDFNKGTIGEVQAYEE